MYIKKEDDPLPTFTMDGATKLSLAVCTLGICLLGVASCFYEWIAAAAF
jgi:NADH-quinone oxidoreductase subunit N